jgi:hypothetical protein
VQKAFFFEIEKRGYMSSGEFVPMVSLEHPEALRKLAQRFSTCRLRYSSSFYL